MLKTALIYGLALATGALALQWLEYRFWARSHAGEIYVALIAAFFLVLGVWVGTRIFPRRLPADAFTPNQRALGSLGITSREYDVLRLLAAGRSNKQIARQLDVSPNTVKTHVARLFEKLKAARRTEAILIARGLELVP